MNWMDLFGRKRSKGTAVALPDRRDGSSRGVGTGGPSAPAPFPVIDAEIVSEDALVSDEAVLDYLFQNTRLIENTAEGETVPLPPVEPGVRRALAKKLSRALPDLSAAEHARIHRLAVRVLERLAQDEVLRVREALAGAIKDIACAPPAVCLTLARDVERTVAEPILHYCVTLTDDDLLALISGRPASWALAAIARRPRVSGPVSTALYEAGDSEATGVLLDNQGAEIPEPTLSRIVEDAASRPEWQDKLARRPVLPPALATRLAGFVDRSVLDLLRTRPDFDAETARQVVQVARRRLTWLSSARAGESAQDRARRLFKTKKLNDEAVSDALSWKDLDFVRAALAYKSNTRLEVIDQVLRSQSPKAVTALAWRAGLSMRLAVQLQARAAQIPPRLLLNARAGTEYPLTQTDMEWQLEFFGIGAG